MMHAEHHLTFRWFLVGILLLVSIWLALMQSAEMTFLGLSGMAWSVVLGGPAAVAIVLGGIWAFVLDRKTIPQIRNERRKRSPYDVRFRRKGMWEKTSYASDGGNHLRMKVQVQFPVDISEARISVLGRTWTLNLPAKFRVNKTLSDIGEDAPRITSARNMLPEYKGTFLCRDDEQRGVIVNFDPPIHREGGENLDFQLSVTGNKLGWKGKVGFKTGSPEGARSGDGNLEIEYSQEALDEARI